MEVEWLDSNRLHIGPFEIDLARIVEVLHSMPPDRVLAVAALLDIIPKMALTKGQDYGGVTDTFQNYAGPANAEGFPDWYGPARRLAEKAERLSILIGQDVRAIVRGDGPIVPANEGWIETMQDLSWLAAITVAMKLRSEQGGVP